MIRPSRRRAAAIVLGVAAALAVGGCTDAARVVEGSAVTVELAGPITSVNAATGHGGTPANLALAAAIGVGFVTVDSDGTVARDESFGRMRVIAAEPLTVRYEIDARARWSDGAPVTAADLLLAWAANSGAVNTPGIPRLSAIDPQTGLPAPGAPADTVFFDGALNAGLQHVGRIPLLDPDDPRVLTMVWDRPFADWELALAPGVPAHVLAAVTFGVGSDEDASVGSSGESAASAGSDDSADAAHGGDSAGQAEPQPQAEPGSGSASISEADAARAASRVVDAITTRDTVALAALATAWNTAFDAGGAALAPAPVSAGPYRVESMVEGVTTLVANDRYEGDRRPRLERVRLVAAADPLASVQRLVAGEVDVIAPQPSAEVVGALDAASGEGIEVLHSRDGLFEHIDLRFARSRNGAIEHPLVRQAFLTALPRQAIAAGVLEPLGLEPETRDSFVMPPDAAGYAASVAANGSARYADSDPVAARALLDSAGAAAPEVCVLYDPANPRRVAQFELVRSAASAAGFVITDCSHAAWLEMIGDPGAWDAALFAWRSTNPGVTGLAARLHTGGRSNYSNHADPAVDALLDRLVVDLEPEGEDRQRLLRELDAALWAGAYGAPLYQEPVIVAHSSEIAGVEHSPYPAGVLGNVWEWSPAAAR